MLHDKNKRLLILTQTAMIQIVLLLIKISSHPFTDYLSWWFVLSPLFLLAISLLMLFLLGVFVEYYTKDLQETEENFPPE